MDPIVTTLARATAAVTFDDLPSDAVHATKRAVLDSIACMYGALAAPIAESVVAALPTFGAGDECTLVGRRHRASALGAVVYNGALLRYLDYNDAQHSEVAPGPRHGHNSEFIPLCLALAERQGLTGQEAITAISLAYDVATGFTDGILGPSLEARGWNMDLRGSLVGPIVAGHLLHLTPEQVADAIGISMSRTMILNVLDSSTEPNTMAKSLRMPLTIHGALLATYLAEAGVSGPAWVIEGDDGFAATVLGGDYDTAPLTGCALTHRVRESALKHHAACYSTHGHLTATLRLVHTHDLRPEDVASVQIRTTTRGARHTGDPARAHPANKETADHSSQFLTAVALVHRSVSPAQYTDRIIADPLLHGLADKVRIEGDPAFDAIYPSAETRITLTSGEVLSERVDWPLGHPKNPMHDDDIVAKLHGCADHHVGAATVDRIVDQVWRLDEDDALRRLCDVLRAG